MTHWVPLVVSTVLMCGLIASGCDKSNSSGGEARSSDTAPASEVHPPPITAEDVERPSSFHDALRRIESYRDSIKEFIAAHDFHSTHRQLDELDFVLSWLPELAQESNVPRTSWETINTTAQEIRELFNKVHARMDADQKANYAEVSDDVEEAIRRLQKIADTNE